MADALTRVPKHDIEEAVLVDVKGDGSNLVFYFSDGTTKTEDIGSYLEALVASIEASVTTELERRVKASAALNPNSGEEKVGDIRVVNDIASIFVGGNWMQIWP